MTALFDKGRYTPVTVIEIGPCPVVQVKTPERDGYSSLQVGFGTRKASHTPRSLVGQAAKAGLPPQSHLQELRDFPGEHKPGDVIKAQDIFQVGDTVDVIGTSKGRGFAGVIKRHHFGRPNQSHGTHETFRGPGSIGSHSYPARTWPGQKMAGRLGGSRVTVKHLKVIQIDAERGLLLVKGAVPGAPGGLVTVRKSANR